MAKIEAIIEGLQIQAKYKPGEWCSAEHDILYGPCHVDVAISGEDTARLQELGWFVSDADVWACHT